MNLEFGLLWIEDNYSDTEMDAIRKAAEVAGFELSITKSTDGQDIDQLADKQRKYHLFDLVLLDLNLAEEKKGDELAADIREKFRSTPILFYSGSEEEGKLRKRMADQEIEGVFCAHRNNFTDRAGEMISDLALSLNRLSGMRGLSMEVVAESDRLYREIVRELGKKDHEVHIIDYLDGLVIEVAQETLDKFPKLDGVDERLKSRAVDSTKLFKIFRNLLKKTIQATSAGEAKDRLSSLSADTKTFCEDVIRVRNVLGHALEQKTDDGWQILDDNGEIFMTVTDFPHHRSKFLSNLRAIREIHKLLVAKKAD